MDIFEISEVDGVPNYRPLITVKRKHSTDKTSSSRPCTVFSTFEPYLERLLNFEVRSDDVWICTFPKCGTTWMQEVVWLLMNSLNFEEANRVDIATRSSYLEYSALYPKASWDTLDEAKSLPSPRLIKTHLPMPLLPKDLWVKKPKIIYVARDPRDAVISYYHHMKGLGAFRGSKEDFINNMLNNQMMSTPFWSHVLEFWELRKDENILFTSYERMKMDLRKVILEVAKFLNKSVSEADMKKLVHHLSFDQMKNNPSCNHEKETMETRKVFGVSNESELRFMRKGEIGTYKEEISDDLIRTIGMWNDEHLSGHSMKEILYD